MCTRCPTEGGRCWVRNRAPGAGGGAEFGRWGRRRAPERWGRSRARELGAEPGSGAGGRAGPRGTGGGAGPRGAGGPSGSGQQRTARIPTPTAGPAGLSVLLSDTVFTSPWCPGWPISCRVELPGCHLLTKRMCHPYLLLEFLPGQRLHSVMLQGQWCSKDKGRPCLKKFQLFTPYRTL
ncbi:collagen alpha-1(I) chain-like [Eubalaena glacialis]|uniref:collagen alpha-1(I) chain-like n=1 Tax=Eubalaena glacialis TaxID=27606 RepID=UPI002A5A8B7E|nr:collagen alpha-1(I) chain-like [Eubalaena glacialis]